jgi:glycosyltransferase involved in cell wall biosynthesis
MTILAIDLTYQPVGGALAQIKEIIINVNSYKFDKVFFYLTKDNAYLFDGKMSKIIITNTVPFSNNSIVLRTIWAQFILPVSLLLNNVDVLFCPGNISPILNSRRKVQWIGTVGPFEKKFISSFGIRKKIILFITKYLMIFSSMSSDIVIYESNYTRDLFVRKYKQSKEKSVVLHIGNDEYYYPVVTKCTDIAKMYSNKEFFLTVSHLYPYKNIEILIDSYYHAELNKRDIYVLIAGSINDKAYYEKLNCKVNKYDLTENIIFLGSVNKQDLRELYSQCKIFVFTSPYENFAYTLVEAMSCSAPIIATNTTAMPETCGEAALYFSPDSEQELTDCMLTFLENENIRKEYKDKSLAKSSEYEIYSVINQKTNKLLEALI